MAFHSLDHFVGNTPLVKLQRLPGVIHQEKQNTILVKLEGNNPAGSVKDRPVLSMIKCAEKRGEISQGDSLIEATSGNTGIALAMVAAMRGFRMTLVMPENQSIERQKTMKAFGAKLILTSEAGGMEEARDVADQLVRQGAGKMLDQFANPDNPRAHYEGTAPEIWGQTKGAITHFFSSMGTTGTITGCSRFFKEKNSSIEIIGCQPTEGSQIPGIRKWSPEYLPKIYSPDHIDRIELVSQEDAEVMARRLASEEGIFAGISSGGALHVALKMAEKLEKGVIVVIICDRGDRYLSTPVFPA